MSCTLLTVSHINEIQKLENLLQDLSSEQQDIVDKGFGGDFEFDEGNNWGDGWEDSDEWSTEVNPKPLAPAAKPWLQSCKVCLSPSEELVVLAKDDKGIFLSRKWSKEKPVDEKPFYEVSWTGKLSTEEKEVITCILAVPLASQQRSSQGNPDWTCVIAGFSTGYIRIYTNNGTQLLSQFLHDGPVLNIKMKTKSSFQPEQLEEMVILYHKAIVTIDGFSLYQSLRACRNQLAKSQASYSSEAIKPPPLAYRKWRTDNQKDVSDCVGCGVVTPNFFDRLRTACITDGPRAKVKGSTPAFNCFVTTGADPFFCVYQALEGSNQPILSDVALAYASKLKSAVFSKLTSATGWFGVGGSQAQTTSPATDVKQQVERGSFLPARFGLFDQRRLAERIQLSPIGSLAVMTDQYNRVLLVNTSTGVIMRMWKGYRDAECGWIVVEEDDDEEKESENRLRRRALFIVIYAPKRGILEIYLTEHGTRVGAFNVGKKCRLLCPSYQSLGQLTTVPMGFNCNKTNQCFLLQADGVIKSIHVPFHCALSSMHSIRAKDLHQLKKITTMIEKNKKMKNADGASDELTAIFLDIQAPSTQRKAVETIVNSTGVTSTFLKSCLEKICCGLKKENENAADESEDLEYQSEREDLLTFCIAQQHLIDLYVSLEKLRHEKHGPDSELDTTVERHQAIADMLHVTLTEASDFLSALDRYKTLCLDSPYKRPVSINSETNIDITTFLACFNIKNDHKCKRKESPASPSSSSSNSFQIEVDMASLSKDVSLSLGCFFFKDTLNGKASASELTLILESSKIPPNQIMMLLTMYTQSEMNSKVLMEDSAICYLHSLISSICSIKGGAEKNTADLPVGDVSTWWKGVRDLLAQSILIGQSLVMAIVCRSVAMEIMAATQKVKMQDESDIVEGGWESVTMDMEDWNLLVCQLEHLVDIDCFIHTNHAKSLLSGVESPTLKKHIHSAEKKRIRKNTLDSSKTDAESSKHSDRIAMLSVKAVLGNGPDLIAQLIAECLVRQGVPGYCLGSKKLAKKSLKFRGRRSTVSSDHEMSVEDIDDDVPDTADDANVFSYDTLAALVDLRKKFPFSLDQDMVWVHCVWESVMVWNEDTEDLSMLRSALIHLSCIHNTKVQCGLGVMMWKAVFKEIVKSTLELITKIGKAPKDRLCKKNVSLSYKALEEFLDVGKKLLEMLNDLDIDEDAPQLEIKTEDIWTQKTSRNQRSIVMQASEEFECNDTLIDHYWCLVTSLHLVMLGNMKSVKPRSLFDTKGRHAFTLPLHATPVLSTELDDAIMKARQQFCDNSAQSVIRQHVDLTFQDEMARTNTSDLLHQLNAILSLGTAFKIDEEGVKRHIACELYSVGLDIAAQEIAMMIEDKDAFSSRMIDVIGGRLVKSLLAGETLKFSETISKLPTNISSWLTKLETSKMEVVELPITKTYHLLQYLNSNLTSQSRDAKFIKELIECLKVFL